MIFSTALHVRAPSHSSDDSICRCLNWGHRYVATLWCMAKFTLVVKKFHVHNSMWCFHCFCWRITWPLKAYNFCLVQYGKCNVGRLSASSARVASWNDPRKVIRTLTVFLLMAPVQHFYIFKLAEHGSEDRKFKSSIVLGPPVKLCCWFDWLIHFIWGIDETFHFLQVLVRRIGLFCNEFLGKSVAEDRVQQMGATVQLAIGL